MIAYVFNIRVKLFTLRNARHASIHTVTMPVMTKVAQELCEARADADLYNKYYAHEKEPGRNPEAEKRAMKYWYDREWHRARHEAQEEHKKLNPYEAHEEYTSWLAEYSISEDAKQKSQEAKEKYDEDYPAFL